MSDLYLPPPPPPPAPVASPGRGSAVRVLLVLTLVALVLFALAGAGVWYAVRSSQRGDVEDATFLHVRLSGSVTDGPATPGIFDDPARLPPSGSEIADALREAADDERITGLYLVLEDAQAGWGTWQELRAAVEAFQASGKPCVAYAPSSLGNGAYYLASACKHIGMAPAGVLMVNGLSLEVSYYKGLFDWIGVEPEFEHVGDYKSFIESYERTGPSDAAMLAYEGLVDSLYAQLVGGIARGRNVTEEEVKAWIDTPTLTPTIARQRRMIDVLAWPDAMRKHAHAVASADWLTRLDQPVDGEAEEHLTPIREYVKELRSERRGSGPKVAVIYAEGSIMTGEGGGLFGDDGSLTDKEYTRWMKQVREDDDIEAVVIRVNSPGGSALASSIMWRENAATKAAGKPIVISMGDYAASGGYLISANADWVVAAPGTLTGSIGVFGGKFDLSGAWAKLGITSHAYQRGAMADLLSFSAGFDDAERAVFKEYLADFYGQFLDIVSTGRKMDRDAVHAVAQGRVWTGDQAKANGLVDQLGTLSDAVVKAAELAELEAYEVKVVPSPKTFFEQVVEALDEPEIGVQVELPAPFALDPRAKAELAALEGIGRDGGIGAYLPGVFRVR